jgi:16S rRNA U1498 N3-methylase RsmE
VTVSLGERILRAETATLTAVAIVQFILGNL